MAVFLKNILMKGFMEMTRYEVFELIWFGAIKLLIALLIFMAVGYVGSNDLKNLVGEEEYAEIVKRSEWRWGY